MLAQLKLGESSVSDLARPYNMSLPAVTKHIKVLEKAGLITKTKEAQWRPCKLKEDGLKEVSDWIEEYRAYWEASFDRLEVYLKSVTAENDAEKLENQASDQKESSPRHSKKGKKNGRKKSDGKS
jgi:Mn-dependent DtxR family transcriptional regulator